MRVGRAVVLEVVAAYPGTAHLQRTVSNAVPGQFTAVIVDDSHFDPEYAAPGFGREIETILIRQTLKTGFDAIDSAKRTQFSHAPALAHFDIVDVAKVANHRLWDGRAANNGPLHLVESLSVFLAVLQ